MTIDLDNFVDSLRGERPNRHTLGGGVANDFKAETPASPPPRIEVPAQEAIQAPVRHEKRFSKSVRDSWRIVWELPAFAGEAGLDVLVPAFTQLRERVKGQNKTEYTEYILEQVETARAKGATWDELASELNAKGLYPLRSSTWTGSRLKSWAHRLLKKG